MVKGNYHDKVLEGIAIYDENNSLFVLKEALENTSIFNSNINKYTYDLKKSLVLFKYFNINPFTSFISLTVIKIITFFINKNKYN